MINSIWKNILNFIRDNLTKKEFNPKLIDLKVIKLSDSRKLNPLVKGLLLDEAKGVFEQISLDSEPNENRLGANQNTKELQKLFNYPIIFSSWYDYIKTMIFGNKNLEYLNFWKLFKKSVSPSHINNNFSFNCDGKFIGYINSQGDIIISSTNIEWNDDYASYLIKSNNVSNEGILAFAWDTLFPNKVFYSTNNSLYECMIIENELVLSINKCYALSGYSKFINSFPSPKGDIIILLYEKSIEVYDMFQNLLFSKRFNTSKFINALYDYKSSVFITYEERKLMIFNVETFDYKDYSYFPGSIIKVINNPKNDNIYIFVIDKTKESSELFMTTLSDISIASDVNLNNDSYHNCDNFYKHCHYVLRPEVYAFQYNLGNIGTKIIDVEVSPNDYRIGILIQENIPNQIQNSLYIFGLTKDKRDNIINKVEPLYNFGHIDGSQIVSFEFNKMIKQNTFLVVRFENDFFIKTKKING